ncbi:Cytosolic sulfotransferase 5 [Platanthera zijinensis]|uniref:Sulfotransferase n=1 Tax=Platanthera zijinensis TaxID=2320716 RepID=A0AAP0G1N1_9ASPA
MCSPDANESNITAMEEEERFISGLPSHKDSPSLRNYKQFWIPEKDLVRIRSLEKTFAPRPTDVFVASMPKAGTTWLKALAFSILCRKEYSPLTSAPHPLLSLNPHECVPFLDAVIRGLDHAFVESMPSPRLLSFHTPFSLLPASIVDTCKIIYVCREPKDTFTSSWKFYNSLMMNNNIYGIDIDKLFELFCAEVQAYGPLWEHALEYWRESLANSDKVLFLRYEEMIDDPAKVMRRMAIFMGCEFSEEEESMGVVEELTRLCSFDSLKKVEDNKNESFFYEGMSVKKSLLYRKGGVGDWVNHLTPEMGRRIDSITEEKLAGSSLRF